MQKTSKSRFSPGNTIFKTVFTLIFAIIMNTVIFAQGTTITQLHFNDSHPSPVVVREDIIPNPLIERDCEKKKEI